MRKGKGNSGNLIVIALVILIAYFAMNPGTLATVTPGGSAIGTCPTETGHEVTFSVKSPLDDDYARIATTASILQYDSTGTAVLKGSNTTLASKPSLHPTTVDCGKDYQILVGTAGVAGTGYYYEVSEKYTANTPGDTVTMDIDPVGTITPTGRTETNATYGAVVPVTIGSGETVSVIVRVKEATAEAAYGQDGYIGICFERPSNISDIKVVGGEQMTDLPAVVSLVAGDVADCYKVKADLRDFSTFEFTAQITAKSGTDPGAAGVEDIPTTILDWASYTLSDNLHYGFTDETGTAIHGTDSTALSFNVH